MKHLKLHEIIATNKEPTKSILIELMQPYFKSLYAYYKAQNPRYEPILMVTSVTNATSYAKIVSSDEFTEAIQDFIGSKGIENENDEDKIAEYETINFCSKMLKQFIQT